MRFGSVCSGITAGQRIGRLTVVERIPGRRIHQWRWRCRCDCGAELVTLGSRLKHGSHKSCGCFRRDRAGNLYRTHGKSQTPEYVMFYDARKRALARALPFTITPADITIPTQCPVLGIQLGGAARDSKPSLDRIVPERGYTPSNIRVISFRANRIKSDANPAELRLILSYMEAGQ